MKLLFIHILFISIRYVLSAKDVSGYFELDNLPKEAYLCSDNDWGRKYICKDKSSVVVWDKLYNCYYRSEYIYVSHDKFDCTNKKIVDKYYLNDIFDEIIDFLFYNPSETVVVYLKNDNVHLTKYDENYNTSSWVILMEILINYMK